MPRKSGPENGNWFATGYGTTITFGGGTIYALATDSFARNNGGAIVAPVAPIQLPESLPRAR